MFAPLALNVTLTPLMGMLLLVTVTVTLWSWPTEFVASAGTNEHAASGTQRFGGKSAENSLVLLFGSVAVAVNVGPMGTALNVTLKLFVPLAAVVTLVKPRNCSPSRKPVGSHLVL